MSISDTITLSSGYDIPILGLGTWQASTEDVGEAVKTALDIGYRHIDTGYVYQNEEAIGEALKQWLEEDPESRKREDVFITSKLPNFGNRPGDVEKYLDLSLSKLQLEYVDLYLIHMPFGFKPNEEEDGPAVDGHGFCLLEDVNLIELWKEMERMAREGKAKSIGVSNFNTRQLAKVYEAAEEIKPSNLQIELHAHLQQTVLREYCKELNVVITAYAPLGSPKAAARYQSSKMAPHMFEDEIVKKLSEKYDKTPAQVLLRYLTQLNIVVIPKSSSPERIKENAEIFDFELSESEMDELRLLDKGEEGRIFIFLFFKGVEKHDEYPFDIRNRLMQRKKSSAKSNKGCLCA